MTTEASFCGLEDAASVLSREVEASLAARELAVAAREAAVAAREAAVAAREAAVAALVARSPHAVSQQLAGPPRSGELIEAAKKGNIDVLRDLIARGADAEEKCPVSEVAVASASGYVASL